MKKEVLSVKDIIKRKEFFKNKKEEKLELYIKSLDANIVIKKPDKDLALEVSELEDGDGGDAYVAYNVICEPNLKDAELRKEFGVTYPPDIVYEIFEVGEVKQIVQKAMEFAGYYKGVDVVEELKN